MRHPSYEASQACPVEAAIEALEGKWKGSILYHLAAEPMRFNALLSAMRQGKDQSEDERPGAVSPRILAKALRDLEVKGIITRTVTPTKPPSVTYALSAHGESLRPVIEILATWGKIYLRQRGVPTL